MINNLPLNHDRIKILESFNTCNQGTIKANVIKIKQLDDELAEVTAYNSMLRIKQTAVKKCHRYHRFDAKAAFFTAREAYYAIKGSIVSPGELLQLWAIH